ncbi:MAG TPA: peptide deformylase [Actinomycetota bacterium]|nr:peptide deformylase [Actinomycetota bacterium]
MAVLPMRYFPDPVLREPTQRVGSVDDDVRKLIADMAETMEDVGYGIGLAAPQVGVQRRVLVYDIGDGLHALVDPEIYEREGSQTDEEGCLSIPGIAFPVERALTIRVRGLDADGRPLDAEVSELEARVIQHEVDHLDGVLFIDRLDREVRREAMRILRERALGGGGTVPGAAPRM